MRYPHSARTWPYTDYGPNPYRLQRDGDSRPVHRINTAWPSRPYCDLCGPFRGRYLRPIGQPDEHGREYRCSGCDEE